MSEAAPPLAGNLSVLRARIARLELDWRARHLPPPSRDSPRPDPDALRVARLLEECGRRLDHVGGRLRSAPSRDEAAREGLRQHLDFLVALTEDGRPIEPADLLSSIQHLETLAMG